MKDEDHESFAGMKLNDRMGLSVSESLVLDSFCAFRA